MLEGSGMPDLPQPTAAPQHEERLLVMRGGGALACQAGAFEGFDAAGAAGLRVFDLTR